MVQRCWNHGVLFWHSGAVLLARLLNLDACGPVDFTGRFHSLLAQCCSDMRGVDVSLCEL